MPKEYNGPPIKGSFKGGNFKVKGKGGSIGVGGKTLEDERGKNGSRGSCYNNLQCQEWYGNEGGDWSCNQSTGNCECTGQDCPNTPTPTPVPSPTPTNPKNTPTPSPAGPTPTPTLTEPQPTPIAGAWCVGAIACDGQFYVSGCSEGTYAQWLSGDGLKQVQNLNQGKTCAEISCVPEATPVCTPTPTGYNMQMFSNEEETLKKYGVK